MRILVAAMTLLVSRAATAEEDASTAVETMRRPVEPNQAPNWSVGAGIGWFQSSDWLALPSTGAGGVGLQGGTLTFLPSVPTPGLSVERTLNRQVSLGLGLTVDFQSALGSSVNLTRGSVSLAAGPRWTLTEASAPIAFSVYAAAMVGYANISLTLPDQAALNSHSFRVGIHGGIAVERALLGQLALRIQLQMLRANLDHTFAAAAPAQGVTTTSLSAIPSPFIELRLAF